MDLGFGALLVIGSSLMWLGKPGDPSVILPLLIAYAIATIGVEFATVFNNAMMPTLVPPEKIGRLSGTGWATGYVGGILVAGAGAGLPRRQPRNRARRCSASRRCSGSTRRRIRATASPGR